MAFTRPRKLVAQRYGFEMRADAGKTLKYYWKNAIPVTINWSLFKINPFNPL